MDTVVRSAGHRISKATERWLHPLGASVASVPSAVPVASVASIANTTDSGAATKPLTDSLPAGLTWHQYERGSRGSDTRSVWTGDIERITDRADEPRRVLRTYPGSMQLVIQALDPGDAVEWERHERAAQFIRVEQGRALLLTGPRAGHAEDRYELGPGHAAIVPAGCWHYLGNASRTLTLRFYTVYSTPVH